MHFPCTNCSVFFSSIVLFCWKRMLRHIFSLVEGVISSFEILIPNFLGEPKRLLTVVRARAGPNFGAGPSFVLRNYFKHILQKESIIVVGQAVKSYNKTALLFRRKTIPFDFRLFSPSIPGIPIRVSKATSQGLNPNTGWDIPKLSHSFDFESTPF